ncbi:MAG: cytidine deaminase [Micrococcales bacterium]|nr:cytidine deaminase [Micrococcales bacterium]
MASGVDWAALRVAAREVAARAYAPYSGLRVGAAALADDGRVVVGCNVENASYGLTLCAECSLVSALHASGGGRLVALVCVSADGAAADGGVLAPCGRCRQLLVEHGGPGLLLGTASGPRTMAQMLPDAFGPDDLPRAPDVEASPGLEAGEA